MLSSRFGAAVRQFSTSSLRQGFHGGTPGENLPFSLNKKNQFTFMYFGFLISGFATPFLIVRHQMLKK